MISVEKLPEGKNVVTKYIFAVKKDANNNI